MKKEDFKPHKMYDPKTGKAYNAKTYEQHLAMKKKGYNHDKPKSKKKTAKKKSKTSFTDAVNQRMSKKKKQEGRY